MADETLNKDAGASGEGSSSVPRIQTTTTPHANQTQPEIRKDGGEQPVVAAAPAPTSPKPADPIKAAAERLSGNSSSVAPIPEEQKPTAEAPSTFDFSKLDADQLARLKQMLAATPDRAPERAANPTLTIRKFIGLKQDGGEFGGYVIDFKNAFQTYIRDEIANITREEVMIPVRFLDPKTGKGEVGTDGAPKFTNVAYKEFMGSAQVRCEVLSTRNQPGRIVEGTVLQKETGRWIEREIKTLDTWFTIKMPADAGVDTFEIEGKVANG